MDTAQKDLTKPVATTVITHGSYSYETLTCPCCGYTVTAYHMGNSPRYYRCNKRKRCGWDSRTATAFDSVASLKSAIRAGIERNA